MLNIVKKYFVVILLMVLVLVTVGWVSRPQKQEIRSRAAAASTLSFAPAEVSIGMGQTFSLAVNIVPSTNIVTAAELHLKYDPALLELISLSPASAFSSVLAAAVIDNPAGKGSITVGAPPLAPVQGPTSVAAMVFRTKSTVGSAPLTLTSDTKVAAINEAGNAVASLVPASIRIVAPTPTPTPRPTPTPTPTPVPLLRGDLDRDGDVDIYDYNILVTNFGRSGANLADIDGNGKVDIFDYNILVTNFGKRR